MDKSNRIFRRGLISAISLLLFLSFSATLEANSAPTCTAYVDVQGNDSNSGASEADAFRTIQRGINSLQPGSVLCVGGGTYKEAIRINASGTGSSPLTIMPYPGEHPILDGRAGVEGLNTGLPSCQNGCSSSELAKVDPVTGKGYVWEALVSIGGSYINFEGFEVKRSIGRGISLAGADHVNLRNVSVHHSRHGGVLIYTDVHDVTFEGSQVWWNGEFAPYSRGGSPDWPMMVMVRGQRITVRNNKVFNNWGEGIGAGRGSTDITIAGNTVYDNFALQIYVDHAQNVIINRNLTYFSSDPTFYRGGSPSECIAINNESSYTGHLTKNITVTNNLARGCLFNFGLWVQGGQWGTEDMLVAHNTFLEGYQGGIRIAKPNNLPHSNVRFKNNLIVQSGGIPAGLSTTEGISFSHNLWWPQQPNAAAVGPGDVFSNPFLSMSGPLGAGALNPGYFAIAQGASPAIQAAIVDGDAVTTDFMGVTRGASADLGALEYTGAAEPTAAPTATAQTTDTSSPTATNQATATALPTSTQQPTSAPTSTVNAPTEPAQVFTDVPPGHPYHDEIEILYSAGFTAGCSDDPLMFCPEQAMTRAESAVFVERGLRGVNYVPLDPVSELFADLPISSWAAKWVHGLYTDGYTSGCHADPLQYCPWEAHSRTEGAVFYLRMLLGAGYMPPEAEGLFADLPTSFWGAKWLEAAYEAGLIRACGTAPLRICPDDPLTRAVAAYMMVQAKELD